MTNSIQTWAALTATCRPILQSIVLDRNGSHLGQAGQSNSRRWRHEILTTLLSKRFVLTSFIVWIYQHCVVPNCCETIRPIGFPSPLLSAGQYPTSSPGSTIWSSYVGWPEIDFQPTPNRHLDAAWRPRARFRLRDQTLHYRQHRTQSTQTPQMKFRLRCSGIRKPVDLIRFWTPSSEWGVRWHRVKKLFFRCFFSETSFLPIECEQFLNSPPPICGHENNWIPRWKHRLPFPTKEVLRSHRAIPSKNTTGP